MCVLQLEPSIKEPGLRQYSLKDISTGFHAQSSTCLGLGAYPEPNMLGFRQRAWIHFLLFISTRATSHLTCQTLHATIIATSHLIYHEPHATNTTTGHIDLLGTTCYHHNY